MHYGSLPATRNSGMSNQAYFLFDNPGMYFPVNVT